MSEDFKPSPVKREITIADFERIDVRVGTIILVEDIVDSRKLMKLTVDFGDHRRSIIAGIKQERENPGALNGRQALFVLNLAPRKMLGQVSEGMLFDIGYADGIVPALAVPERNVPNGSRVG
jgi:tRNA-binding protein